MQISPYPDVNKLLELLLLKMQIILGKKLVGLYLEGSLVIGDFDLDVSDIDLVAALSADINDKEFKKLEKMHADLVTQYTEWDNRIEVCYITVDALKTVKSRTSRIVNISPGEPFHRVEAKREWLMNWYLTREKSKMLLGPPAATLIEPISKEEFVQAVRTHVKKWRIYVKDTRYSRSFQAYAILTLCRAFYVSTRGEQVSKKKAAAWIREHYPEWAALIENALLWCKDSQNKNIDHTATYPETYKFVNFIINEIER